MESNVFTTNVMYMSIKCIFRTEFYEKHTSVSFKIGLYLFLAEMSHVKENEISCR